MIRLHIVVEGQTEEEFVRSLLSEHLGTFEVSVDVRCVETSRRRARIYRGGLLDYGRARRDLALWMRQDSRSDSYFTCMFDFYALPRDFPGFVEAKKQTDPYKQVEQLETAFAADLNHQRFVPYIQLHEFEALLFSDPSKLRTRFEVRPGRIAVLKELVSEFGSPELIDDGADTAPSKRIIKEIPEYEGSKLSAGPLVAQKIGLERIRAACRHFDEWLKKIESLGIQKL